MTARSILRSWAHALGGEVSGRNSVLCAGPGHSLADRSLHVTFKSSTDFVVCSFAGDDWRDCRDHVRARLGISCDPTPHKTAPEPAKGSTEYDRRQHEKAAWLWAKRRPITGTIAEKYLRARRIICPLPPTLAFLLPLKPEHHPAMIAAFAIPDEPEPGILGKPRDVASVHLTLLKPDGTDKADTKPDKIFIGSPAGLPVVVAPPNDLMGLAITEGIEDALTAHQATGFGAWAAGAAGFMPKLADVVPNYIEAMTIFTHSDKAGRDNAHRLAAALRNRGIEVTMEGL
jgi:hypothetical protein